MPCCFRRAQGQPSADGAGPAGAEEEHQERIQGYAIYRSPRSPGVLFDYLTRNVRENDEYIILIMCVVHSLFVLFHQIRTLMVQLCV